MGVMGCSVMIVAGCGVMVVVVVRCHWGCGLLCHGGLCALLSWWWLVDVSCWLQWLSALNGFAAAQAYGSGINESICRIHTHPPAMIVFISIRTHELSCEEKILISAKNVDGLSSKMVLVAKWSS